MAAWGTVGMAVRRGVAEAVHECWECEVAPPPGMPFHLQGAPHFHFPALAGPAQAGGGGGGP